MTREDVMTKMQMTAGDLANLMDWDAVADLGVAPEAQVTILADGTVNALERGALIADVARIQGAELEYVRAGEYGCADCSAEMLPYSVVPSASDSAAWAKLAALHADGCEWVATRAHRMPSHQDGTCLCGDRPCLGAHVGADGGHCECGTMSEQQYRAQA
jgi:hypothetical protein